MARITSTPTVAVVAVHGVGDHRPGASAHAVADLLLRLRYPGGAARYTSFGEERLRIPVRPAAVGAAEPAAPTPEHALMRAQLAAYESDHQSYDTIRIEGDRLAPPAADASAKATAGVHLYEMHWADLSRTGASALRLFAEMYQLLFHLAVLGDLALRHAGRELPDDTGRRRAWDRHLVLHSAAVQLLTLAVPVSWLVMLATVLGFLVLLLHDGPKSAVLGVAAAGGASLAAWWLVYRSDRLRARIGAWTLIPVAGLACGWLGWAQARAEEHAPHRDAALLLVWLALAAAALLGIFRAYDRVCPGARRAGKVALLGGAIFIAAAVSRVVPAVWGGSDRTALANAMVNAFELETLVVVGAWYLLYGCAAAAAFVSWRAARGLPRDGRLARALWTARATLALSASSVLVFTFVLWAAVLRATGGMLPTEATPEALWTPFQQATYQGLFERIMALTAGAGFPLLLIFLVGLVVFAAIAFLPAAAREVWPPRRGGADWEAAVAEGRVSERLGRWLTSGFASVARFVSVLFLAVFVVQPVVSLLGWLPSLPVVPLYAALDLLERYAGTIIGFLGGSLAAATVGVLALRGRLHRLALGFRPVLDAALDVDNYLREHPAERTPRARITERYTSLLRYLGHWRDAAGRPYQAIVFVAHSQGTVITAETLAWMAREPDPELASLVSEPPLHPASRPDRRLYLFTMGSPLRQLYATCFPHLFGWLRDEKRPWGLPVRPSAAPRTGAAPALRERDDEGHVVTGPELASDLAPAPADFGLVRWVNAYRTGDYVGRELWREGDSCPWIYRAAPDDVRERVARYDGRTPPVVFVSEDAEGSRRELCVGAGAHTHYWDETAHAVALELDLLVADAAATVPATPPPAAALDGPPAPAPVAAAKVTSP